MFKLIKTYINQVAMSSTRPDFYCNQIDIPDESGEMIKIVPVGEFPNHHNGPHRVTAEDVQKMAENFAASGTDLLFDLDHNSLWGNTRAAGWSPKVEAREDGLYIEYPNFVPEVAEMVKNREYRYFSPVYVLFAEDKDGTNIGARIDSVALTNRPYMDREIDHIGNTRRNPKPEKLNMFPDWFMKLLGLSNNATAEEVNSKLNATDQAALLSAIKATETDDPAPVKPEPDPEPVANSDGDKLDKILNMLQAQGARLDSLESVNAASAADRVDALVNSAISQFKILPAHAAAWVAHATADFDAAKQALDAISVNAVKPSMVRTPQVKNPVEGEKVSALDAAINSMRSNPAFTSQN
jgi:phage I-like protein